MSPARKEETNEPLGIAAETLERLYAVIKTELGVDVRALDRGKNLVADLGLDSVQLTTVALSIDAEFGINLPLSILEGANFDDFLRVFAEEIRGKKGG